MKLDSHRKQLAVGVTALCVLLLLAYLLISKIWSVFSSVNPTLGAGLLAAAATITVSLISVLISKHLDRKALIANHLREKKVPTYEKIIRFIFEITFASKLGKKPPAEKEVIKFFAEITQELVIWGSDEILIAFYKFRTESMNIEELTNKEPLAVLFTFEDLLLAIRKDLGHKNSNISGGKILGLFVNDLPSSIAKT